MKILVTAGATREPIDAVRFLSNVSTGSTGAELADAFQAQGHEVALLRGEGAVAPRRVKDVEVFSSGENLRARLRRRLASGEYGAVFMAVAVGDYRPAEPAPGKIDSEAERLSISLVRNPKILPELKSYSPTPLAVVGFKLTVKADPAARSAAVAAQFAAGGVDFVVHNDLEEIRRGGPHPYWLHRAPGSAPQHILGAPALAAALEPLLAAPGPHAHARP